MQANCRAKVSLETIVRHFCDMTIGLFLRRTDVVLSRFGGSRSLQFAP